MSEIVFGGIETGGTKLICAVGTNDSNLQHITRIENTTFDETMSKVINYFDTMKKKYSIPAIGIASFGPIDLHTNSKTYGYITNTPKLEWQNKDLLGTIRSRLGVKATLDIDVNGAALAEGEWGNAQGLSNYIYITVGTGVGLGVVINNQPLHGLIHPEGGHMLLPLHPKDPSNGVCSFHSSCLEGLASAPAIKKRWNKDASELPDEHFAWELESYYLAQAICNFILCLSPQRIILGGGVMKRKGLIEKIRNTVIRSLANYVQHDAILSNIETYIVTPKLEYCGVLGGIFLAKKIHSTAQP